MKARPARPGDAQSVADLLAEVDASFGRTEAMETAALEEHWLLVDLERDSWLLHADGRLAAVAWLMTRDSAVVIQVGAVRPSEHGRGLGAQLVELSERRAREIPAEAIRADTNGADAAAARLFEARGYRPVRRFYAMAIELDGAPRAPQLPGGIEMRPFERRDARAFYDAVDEAFADEWGFVRMPYDEWLRLRVDGGDTSLWFVAWDGDEIAGFVRCDPEYRGAGLVRMLGVRKPWRRRGLGEALLLHAFETFHRRGQRRVTLGVDAENPTGATRLYERVGMAAIDEGVVYEKGLR